MLDNFSDHQTTSGNGAAPDSDGTHTRDATDISAPPLEDILTLCGLVESTEVDNLINALKKTRGRLLTAEEDSYNQDVAQLRKQAKEAELKKVASEEELNPQKVP